MNDGIGSKKTYEDIIASRVDKPLEMNDLTANMLVFSNEQRDVLSNSIVGSIDEIPRIETCARLSTSRFIESVTKKSTLEFVFKNTTAHVLSLEMKDCYSNSLNARHYFPEQRILKDYEEIISKYNVAKESIKFVVGKMYYGYVDMASENGIIEGRIEGLPPVRCIAVLNKSHDEQGILVWYQDDYYINNDNEINDYISRMLWSEVFSES